MITVLLQKIIDMLSQHFPAAITLLSKLNLIEEDTEEIRGNVDSMKTTLEDVATQATAAAAKLNTINTTVTSIDSNAAAIKTNSDAIKNNILSMSSNVGNIAAYSEDTANNTLDIDQKITSIASDTTDIRTATNDIYDENAKIYDAVKWLLVDKTTTEDIFGTGILSFATDMTEALNNCILKFNSNVGFSSAEVFRTGKNLINATGQSSITTQTLLATNIYIKAGTYTFSAKVKNNASVTARIRLTNISDLTYTQIAINVGDNGVKSATANLTKDGLYSVSVSASGSGYNVDVDEIQLELGNSPTAYIPYSGTSVVIPFSDTYYGGVIDVLNGIGVVTDTPNTDPSISISFTPGVVNTLKGLNNIFANIESEINITYTETVKFYLDKQDNA